MKCKAGTSGSLRARSLSFFLPQVDATQLDHPVPLQTLQPRLPVTLALLLRHEVRVALFPIAIANHDESAIDLRKSQIRQHFSQTTCETVCLTSSEYCPLCIMAPMYATTCSGSSYVWLRVGFQRLEVFQSMTASLPLKT